MRVLPERVTDTDIDRHSDFIGVADGAIYKSKTDGRQRSGNRIAFDAEQCRAGRGSVIPGHALSCSEKQASGSACRVEYYRVLPFNSPIQRRLPDVYHETGKLWWGYADLAHICVHPARKQKIERFLSTFVGRDIRRTINECSCVTGQVTCSTECPNLLFLDTPTDRSDHIPAQSPITHCLNLRP
ncbi:hypothetical protein Acsp02_60310 [Actinoplanes sp. NBRC 103695]|nr:hypothetical protein Acsp02_60310 [Actinoplanes sp. NBRC 103695]